MAAACGQVHYSAGSIELQELFLCAAEQSSALRGGFLFPVEKEPKDTSNANPLRWALRWGPCGFTPALGFTELMIPVRMTAGRSGTGPYKKQAASRSAVEAGVLTRPCQTVFQAWAGRPVSGPYKKNTTVF